jgi:hypothetical protein
MAAPRWATPRCGRGHRRTVHHFIDCGHPLHHSRPLAARPDERCAPAAFTFLLRQKSNQKRRTRRAAFCFCFFVAAISVAAAFIEPAAVRKRALTLISNLNHRVAQTGSRRRPPTVSKNSVGADGWAIQSLNSNSRSCIKSNISVQVTIIHLVRVLLDHAT